MLPFKIDLGTKNNKFSSQFGSGLQYVKNSDQKESEDDQKKSEDGNGSRRKKRSTKKKQPTDVAGIITASALGLNSITSAISAFTGKGIPQQNAAPPSPRKEEPKKKNPSPMLVIGVIAGVMFLIGLLAFARRKSVAPPISRPLHPN